ncbi:MAG: GGDEF domain-containing phosphodiesterase [Campylobacterota bacterium]|nr:GGDEF domain-containing phosphodiesterase [Campylobacterota bacterium]
MEFIQDLNSYLVLNNIFIYISIIFVAFTTYLIIRKKKLLENNNKKIVILKKAFDISEDAVLILSDQYKVLYTNKSMRNLLQVDKSFQNIPKVKVKKEWEFLDTFVKNIPKTKEEKTHIFPRVKLLTDDKNKEIFINLYVNSSSVNTMMKSECYIVSMQNLTKVYEQKLIEYKHKLTKLPNKSQAFIDLNAIYSKIHLDNNKLSLIIINIDNFSQLRAIIGYEQSNTILIEFANYLKEVSEKYAINVYHTCHNNFLITDSNSTKEDILNLCKKIQEELALFYKLDSIKLHLTASIGISIYSKMGSAQYLLDNAYKALAESEKIGYGRTTFYESKNLKNKYDELELYNSVHEAIEKNEFEVYYQPIIDVRAKKIVAAEALIRWIHPKYGFISPDIFIPMMEKTGFIVDLGQYVLEEVFSQQKSWDAFDFKKIQVAINMSLFEIETDNFVKNVENKLKEYKVNPKLIKFEITEGAAMKNEQKVYKQLLALKRLGVSISLDDFGTGYTSFSYLKKFPADILKIDKSFIDNIVENEEDQRIVKAMIELGHNLGMKIIVEGIETKKMVEIIASYGCDYMQGYFFSKPLPVFEFQELLRKR